MLRNIVVVTIFPLLGIFPCEAQDVEHRLAGQGQNKWVLTEMEKKMGGSSGRCKSGEEWIFSRDHQVQIEKCEDQKVVLSKESWSVAKENKLDTVLTVGADRYYITFHDSSRGHYMVLRTVVTTKTQERIDREFHLDRE